MHATHTAVTVSDLEATTDFYEGCSDWSTSEFTGDDGVVNYYVGTDDGASLQFKFDPNADGAVDPSGIDHLAFSVGDVDATFERVLEESGCDVHLEPTTFDAANRRAAFVYDPDGYVVEFVQPI